MTLRTGACGRFAIAVAGFDANGNGLICGKLQPGFTHASKPFAAYLDNFTDDNSSSG